MGKNRTAYASTETKLRGGHEVRPLVVLQTRPERITIYKTSDGVSVPTRPMRVQLPALIALRDVHRRKVTNARHLHVVRRLHEMHALQSPIRDRARATAGLGAPRDLFLLRVANGALLRRSPETEIVDVVDPHRLAQGRLGGLGAAVVRARLAILGLVW